MLAPTASATHLAMWSDVDDAFKVDGMATNDMTSFRRRRVSGSVERAKLNWIFKTFFILTLKPNKFSMLRLGT